MREVYVILAHLTTGTQIVKAYNDTRPKTRTRALRKAKEKWKATKIKHTVDKRTDITEEEQTNDTKTTTDTETEAHREYRPEFPDEAELSPEAEAAYEEITSSRIRSWEKTYTQAAAQTELDGIGAHRFRQEYMGYRETDGCTELEQLATEGQDTPTPSGCRAVIDESARRYSSVPGQEIGTDCGRLDGREYNGLEDEGQESETTTPSVGRDPLA